MLNSPMLSIFQHFHAIPLRSPLISLRSKWRLTGFSRRFTPKNPVRLHNPFGELPRWGAKRIRRFSSSRKHLQAIPLRSPLISLRSKWRLTGFSRRFTPKNPVRLHKPSGQLPRLGAKNVLPLHLTALSNWEGIDFPILFLLKYRQ